MYFVRNKATTFWALLIAVLSLFPGDRFPKVGISRIDLAVHFFFYSVFVILLLRGNFRESEDKFLRKNPISSAFVISISFGVLMEILQGTIFISRSGELFDVIANSVGSFCGWILFEFFSRFPITIRRQ